MAATGNVEIDPVKYGAMWQQVQDMDQRMQKMEKQIDQLVEMANKSKGGMWLGLALLGGVSTFVALVAGLFNFVKDHIK